MTRAPAGQISLVAIGVFYAGMLGVAVGISWFAYGELPLVIPPGPEVPIPLWAKGAIGAGIGVGIVLLSRLAAARTEWARRLEARFAELLGPVTPAMAGYMAMCSAVAEELLFRGVALRGLGLVGSSLLFGALHVGRSRDFIPWTLFATGVGFVLGWVTVVTGDVTAAIVAHLTINYFNFLAIAGGER